MTNLPVEKWGFDDIFASFGGFFDSMFKPSSLVRQGFCKTPDQSFPKFDLNYLTNQNGDNTGVVMHCTVPGWDNGGLSVKVEEINSNIGVLVVSGDKQNRQEGEKAQFSGIKRSKFRRFFVLKPLEKYNLDALVAKLEKGILTIELPYNAEFDVEQEIKVRNIEIN